MCNIAIYITGASLRFIYLSVKPVLSTCSGSGIILALEIHRDFPGGSDSKESACNVGDLGLIPGSGRAPGEGSGNPLQYSWLKNLKDRGEINCEIRTDIYTLLYGMTNR